MCSMPTDRRTVSCVTPAAASSSSLSWECVVVALWIASDFASPMLARWLNSSSALDERPAGLAAALDAEGDQRAAAAREHAPGDLVVRVGLEARVVDPLRPPSCSSRQLGDRQARSAVALHAQRQRLDALQEQEGVERRERRARVAQQDGAHAADVGRRARARRTRRRRGSCGSGCVRPGKRVGVGDPVEAAGVDDDAADRGAVAADELRQRVHDDVGAVVERRGSRSASATVLSTISGRPCGVRGVGPGRRRRATLRRGLPIVSPNTRRVLSSVEPRDGVRVVGVGEAHLDAVLRQRVGEQVVGAAVELRDRDDVVAGARDVEHASRSTAAWPEAVDQAAMPPSSCGEALLEHVPGRVHDPRVDVARHLEREQVGGVLGVVERRTTSSGRSGRRARWWSDRATGRRAGRSFPLAVRSCCVIPLVSCPGNEKGPPVPGGLRRRGDPRTGESSSALRTRDGDARRWMEHLTGRGPGCCGVVGPVPSTARDDDASGSLARAGCPRIKAETPTDSAVLPGNLDCILMPGEPTLTRAELPPHENGGAAEGVRRCYEIAVPGNITTRSYVLLHG